ncbi:MAG: PadR family transcriptional regulator [Candidatus Heimdallarchaeota archaeon]|nr:PadR family transcriptional regulator [Candidatus Heimdallarchaeota archaeon]
MSSDISKAILGNWEVEIRRGVIQLLVFNVLSEQEIHGKAICDKIYDITNGIVQIPLGTVYPMLRRFIREGLIESKKPSGEDMRRTIYKLNETGLNYYHKIQESWLRYSVAVSNTLHRKQDRNDNNDNGEEN